MVNVLVVIDVQNDFITGSLGNPEALKKIPNIVKKIRNFKDGIIFVTHDTHLPNYLSTKEGTALPVEHCITGTNGWEIESNVKAALEDARLRNITTIEINKPSFGSVELANAIRSYSFTHSYKNNDSEAERCELNIEFVGFCTDICVVSNALITKAQCWDIADVTVDASCCAGVTPATHEAALATMKMCQINVINE